MSRPRRRAPGIVNSILLSDPPPPPDTADYLSDILALLESQTAAIEAIRDAVEAIAARVAP